MKILTPLIILWFTVSLVRLGYNYLKIYTQERDWIFLTDYQKKARMFGQDFINISQPDFCANYPQVQPGSRLYYFNFYYLYPHPCRV